MRTFKALAALAFLLSLCAVGFLYSGLYPMGADAPHNGITYWALDTLRERSIARAIRDIDVPPLDDPQQLLTGGADYNEMCTSCHLKPGQSESEFTQGLYPRPPNLSTTDKAGRNESGGESSDGNRNASAARQFWIIKHGIKASGMAAFGPTHDDERIWAMVAFLQKLPTLNELQYQIITAHAVSDSEHDAGAEPNSHRSGSTPRHTH